MKSFRDCYTTDDWLEYYEGASRSELKAVMKGIPNRSTTQLKNKRKAVYALLYG